MRAGPGTAPAQVPHAGPARRRIREDVNAQRLKRASASSQRRGKVGVDQQTSRKGGVHMWKATFLSHFTSGYKSKTIAHLILRLRWWGALPPKTFVPYTCDCGCAGALRPGWPTLPAHPSLAPRTHSASTRPRKSDSRPRLSQHSPPSPDSPASPLPVALDRGPGPARASLPQLAQPGPARPRPHCRLCFGRVATETETQYLDRVSLEFFRNSIKTLSFR